MKKFLSAILALAMMFSLVSTQVAFAAEAEDPVTEATVQEDAGGIQPYGSLSGYGQKTVGSGKQSGSFSVPVTGSEWSTAQLTFRIEGFSAGTQVRMELYRPNGTFAWGTLSNGGYYLNSQQTEVKNQRFANGMVGTYTVQYEILTFDGSTPSGGTMICHIY